MNGRVGRHCGRLRAVCRYLGTLPALALSIAGFGTRVEAAEPGGIASVKPLVLKTPLVEKRRPRAMIVAPDDGVYRRLAERVQKTIESATGARLPIRGDREVTAAEWEKQAVLTLGNLMTNRFVEMLYRMHYVHADARYPGRGGIVVRTVHDPWGTGANVVFVGGSDEEGVAASVAHFLGLIEPGEDLVLEPLLAVRLGEGLEGVSFAGPPDVAQLHGQFKRDSNRSLIRRAGECGFNYSMGGHADWALGFRDALFEHRSRPYMGWDDTHMELWYALIAFDLVEESPALSDQDRLGLTQYLLEVLHGPEGVQQQTFRRALPEQAVRHNHAMLPALDAYFGGRYFQKYYGLKETEAWIRDAALLFKAQEGASKTACDATAYESTAALPLPVIYALAEPGYGFLSNGTAARAMDRIIGCMDNRFELSGNGDVYSAFPMPLLLMTNWYYRDGRYQWVMDRRREKYGERSFGKTLRYYIDGRVEPVKPVDMVGVRRFEVDPEFYRSKGGPQEIPPERRFDKISFRADFDPDRQYLLLDGLTIGSHGHDDVNAIIRFTDHDRVFLVDDSYSEGPNVKDHNAVVVLRDGLRGPVPAAAEVLALADLDRVGMSRTAARDHSGTDWIRSIVWAKDAYFVVIDELRAREAGEYRMTCLWRTLGEGVLEEPVFRTSQAPGASGVVREEAGAGGGKVLEFRGGMLGATAHLPEGDYEAWAVGWGYDGGSNSVWVSVDGKRLPAFHLREGRPEPGGRESEDVARVGFRVDKSGPHRLALSLRERGPVHLDRLVIRSVQSGEETVLEAEAFGNSVAGRTDEFFLEGFGADRVEAAPADERFSRFWSDYRHATPQINVLRQEATRRMAAGEQHRFMNLFYASNEEEPRSFELWPGDGAFALVEGDSRAVVGVGPLRREDLMVEAEVFHLSETGFSLAGGVRLEAGDAFFESTAPVSISFDVESGTGTVSTDRAVSVGLIAGRELTVDGARVKGKEKGGLVWTRLEPGRHAVAVAGIPDWAVEAFGSEFEATAASARDGVEDEAPEVAPEAAGMALLWSRPAGAPVTVAGDADSVFYVGTDDGRVLAFGRSGEALWEYEAGSRVTALHARTLKGAAGVFVGTGDSRVCWLDEGGRARGSVQIDPLHPSLRYRAPTGESDVVGICAAEHAGEVYVFVGVANGWLRCLDGSGKQRWEFFGNARAFDQIGVGDLDGSGESAVVATGQPSHFGSCIALDLAGEQKGNNGVDGWARVTTQMRVGDFDGDGQDEVVCGTGLGNLYLLKNHNLRTAWMKMLGDEIMDLVVAGPEGGRRIVAASRSYYVYSVGTDGAVGWASNLGDEVVYVCAVRRKDGDELAAACADGRLVVLSMADGTVLARYPAGAPAAGLAAMDLDGDGEDEIVAGLADGSVIALKRN